MAEYGIPYMGSKGSIANEIICRLPKAENFYDIFGGGFSIMHAMLQRRPKDFKRFHFNEIRPGICELIKAAISGKYSYKNFSPPFISSDEFKERKSTCAYTQMLWSFGNNGENYLFSKKIEPYKKSMHNAVVFNKFDDLAKKVFCMDRFKEGYSVKDRRLFLRAKIEYYRINGIPDFLLVYLNAKQLVQLQQLEALQQLQQLQQLEALQRLEALQQLQRLEPLKQLEFYSTSYNEIKIKPDSVVYCDPPYEGTASYSNEFDHKAFLDWADAQTEPVFISEYKINDNRFSLLFEIHKLSLLGPSSGRKKMTERLYGNKAAQNLKKELNA